MRHCSHVRVQVRLVGVLLALCSTSTVVLSTGCAGEVADVGADDATQNGLSGHRRHGGLRDGGVADLAQPVDAALPDLALPADLAPTADAGTVPTSPCTKTLAPGANLAAEATSAANGAVLCLDSGDFGSVHFSNIARSGFVTLRSTTGIGAKLSPQISNSDYLRFQSMTLRDAGIENCSTNIQLVGNTWAKDTSGVSIFDYGFNCPTTDKHILLDGNTFIATRPAWSEGRIGIVQVIGVTISNNLIQGVSIGNGGDGIQTGGDNGNIQIGPGNIFRDILQAPCDATPGVPHCDAIQIVGGGQSFAITGNWFDNVEVPLQHHDGTAAVRFADNLVTGASQFWAYGAQANGTVIEHNTFYKQALIFWGENGSGVTTSSGIVARSNLLLGSDDPSFCTGCSASYNLGSTSGQAIGSNALVGTPTFVGGSPANITTWAGWQLAAGSPGKNTGHDGKDRGTTYFK